MRKILIIAIALILAVFLGVVLVFPKYQDFINLQGSIEEKNKELESKRGYFAKIEQIAEDLKQYDAELAKISSALPDEPNLPALFNFLQQSGSQSGLILEKIDLSGIVTSLENQELKTTEEIMVELELGGSYPSFKSFLQTLEKSARLIGVETISFSSPEDAGDPFSFKLNVKTQSY